MTLQTLDLVKQEQQAALGPLAKALRDLEIEPFDPGAVEVYKKLQMEKTFERLKPEFGHEVPRERIEYYAREVELQVRAYMDGPGATIRYYVGGAIPVFVALLWRRLPLGILNIATRSAADVPEYVLNKAEQIAEKIPGVTFEVDELRGEKDTFDPFLVAKLGGEEYYCEIWGADEKDFKRS